MGRLLSLFTGNPVTMIYVALAIAAVSAAAGGYSGWTLNGWRLGAKLAQAEKERDHWQAQTAVVADAAKACTAGVDQAKRVGDAALAATGQLVAAADRLNLPREKEVQRITTIVERPISIVQAADCNWGWSQIEAQPSLKAGAPSP